MKRFKVAMSIPSPPFIIETKGKRKSLNNSGRSGSNNSAITKNAAKSFSIGSGEFRTRLFRTSVTSLKENCNASSMVVLAKGTLNEKTETTSNHSNSNTNSGSGSSDYYDNSVEENEKPTRNLTALAFDNNDSDNDTASFDLVLDDNAYEYDEKDNSMLEDYAALVRENPTFSDDESEVSSIGMDGDYFGVEPPSPPPSRLLMADFFPPPASNSDDGTTTMTTTTTPLKERTNGPRNTTTTTATTTSKPPSPTMYKIHQTANDLATARHKTALGHAYLQRRDYANARAVLLEASQSYESMHGGPNHTSVALALDTYAVACLQSAHHYFKEGLDALQRAFRIRCHHLGVWHVDTVDTYYNKIAEVHWQTDQLQEALEAYQQVWKVRTAILGPQHPLVAITAFALAKVHLQLGNSAESKAHFALAKGIYEQLGMRYDHKAMAKLVREQNHVANGKKNDAN